MNKVPFSDIDWLLRLANRIEMSNNSKNIAIIGAGPAGLLSAKESLQKGFNITVYERNETLGGVWRYTDEIGKDKYGLDIHSAMYKNLRYFTILQSWADVSYIIIILMESKTPNKNKYTDPMYGIFKLSVS